MAPTTVSTWLARLEDDGVAKRRRNPDDGRSHLIELTKRGRAELDQALPDFSRAVRRVRGELGDDLDDVLDGLDRLVAALRTVLAEGTSS
jgi:DNA-binding MarR family transcriptional regulator